MYYLYLFEQKPLKSMLLESFVFASYLHPYLNHNLNYYSMPEAALLSSHTYINAELFLLTG